MHVPPASRTMAVDREIPTDILEQARAGDLGAREALMGWAYATASLYYQGKTRVEAGLSRRDAEDLAGAFVVEFSRVWPRVGLLYNYTRRMLRNNLNRYLRRKRERLGRETPIGVWNGPLRVCDSGAVSNHDPALEGETDDDHIRSAAVRRVLDQCDPVTRELMLLRASEMELTYRQIALMLETTESALRMRATRFYQGVRDEYTRMSTVWEQGRSWCRDPEARPAADRLQ